MPPIIEIGSFQVAGQEGLADLTHLFLTRTLPRYPVYASGTRFR
jgi:hypothetical protein